MAEYNLTLGEFYADTLEWPEDERTVALYLLTCEHRRTEGLFKAPAHITAYELAGTWTVHRVKTAMSGLEQRGWLVVEGPWVCIAKALKVEQNRPASPSAIKGCLDRVANAPKDGPAWAAFLAGAERWCPNLADVITGRQVIVRGKTRGLRLEPATPPPTTPVTPPVTGVVTPPVAAPEAPDSGAATTPVTEAVTSSPSSSLSNSTSPSVSPSSSSSDFVEAIRDAARRGPSPVLARQADDDNEVKRIAGQITLASTRAAAATALVVEWLTRPGEPMDAQYLSILVPAAVRKVKDADAEAEAHRVEHLDDDAQTAWAAVLDALRGRVDETTLELWVSPLKAFHLEGGVLYVGGEAHLARWAADRCTPLLSEVANDLGVAARVDIRVASFAGAAA